MAIACDMHLHVGMLAHVRLSRKGEKNIRRKRDFQSSSCVNVLESDNIIVQLPERWCM